MQTLKVSVDPDGIALITIDLPDRSMNVLTPQLTLDLQAAVEQVADTSAIRGAILTSGKPGSFVAGADLHDILALLDAGIDAVSAARLGEPLGQVLRRLETCGKPFAAALNGTALGGGLELALACHWRVLADHPKAVVGLPEEVLPGASPSVGLYGQAASGAHRPSHAIRRIMIDNSRMLAMTTG